QTLHLKPEASMMGAIQVYIFKESGKIVETTTLHKTYLTQVFEIDVQNLNRGLYFVKMINDNTTATFKMSKE
ncbi:MAG: T9SS type A sorting domain-containing protein, partial [Reichenbachiella sp.]|uniref:T9SS type A sorting domain-containing protein n=2 Tax=Reichenbachiella sp. TaxID=2184521 RepID=UPI0032655139